MSEMKTLKFPGDAEPREIVDAKAREDISKLSEEIGDISSSGLSAATAAKNQVPTADGNGGWSWQNGVNNPILGNYIHLSFDDVSTCMSNLVTGGYTSLWDEPFFGWLKSLHDTYGAKFSLYLYNISNLGNVPDTYKSEFLAASHWLKFGLHSDTSSGTYSSATYDKGKSDWNTVVEQVIRFAGSHGSIDRIPRLNYFAGTLEALKGMRDAECGALGFLCSDAVRDSYYLDSTQNTYLLTHDHLIDFANGLLFYQTDFRGDWFKSGFSSEYTYDAPTQGNVYDELAHRFATAKYGDTFGAYIWFCHEWQIYSGITLNSDKIWVEDACKFAADYGIPFDYPQNRIGINPTSLQFLFVASGSDDSGDTGDGGGSDNGGDSGSTATETVEWPTCSSYTTTATVKINPSDLVYTAGATIYGGTGGSGGKSKEQTGRAAHIGYALAVSGGETVSLMQNVPNATLYYAIYESSASPIGGANAVTTGETALQWLSDPVTLQAETRYICITFKNGDGSVDFTADQLALLPSCITVS